MPLDFLSGAQGEPKNLRRLIAPQTTLGVPTSDADEFVEYRSNGGPFRPSRASVPRSVISRTKQKPLPGKMTLSGGPFDLGDVDPGNIGMIHMLANFFGNYSVEVIPETRAGGGNFVRWIFGASQATSSAPYLTAVEDNDVLPRFRGYDIRLNSLSAQASANAAYAINFGFLGGSHDMFGPVSQTAGTGSEIPVFTGTWSGNWEPSLDRDIYLRVESQDADEVEFVAKVGSAASYGAISFTVPRGTKVRIVDSTSGEYLAGETSYTETPYVYVGNGTYVVADEFRALNRRAALSTSLGIERPIASVNTLFMLDGAQFRSEGGWTYESSWQRGESQADVSGVQGATPVRSGVINTTLTPTRELRDLTLQKLIHQATNVAAYIEAGTDVYIPGTIRRFRFMAIFPYLQASGDMYGTESGGENTQESVTLETGTPDSTYTVTDPDQNIEIDEDFAIVVETNIGDLYGAIVT